MRGVVLVVEGVWNWRWDFRRLYIDKFIEPNTVTVNGNANELLDEGRQCIHLKSCRHLKWRTSPTMDYVVTHKTMD